MLIDLDQDHNHSNNMEKDDHSVCSRQGAKNAKVISVIVRTQSDSQCRLTQTPTMIDYLQPELTIQSNVQIFTLAEALGAQSDLQEFVGATLVANIGNSRLKSLLRIPVNHSAFSAPLREKIH